MKLRKCLVAVFFTLLCASAAAFVAACTEEPEQTPPPVTYTVTFDVKGHGTAPQPLTDVAAGSKIKKPDDPEADGFIFGGWFKEDALDNEWNFDADTVKADVTLYASWTAEYTVTFDVKGHGTAPAAQAVAENANAQKPEDPEADGFVFNGWCKDEGLTEAWIFSIDKVTENVTLYADWKQIHPVAYGSNFESQIENVEYFSVAHTGSYYISVSVDGGEEGDLLAYRLDDEPLSAVLTDTGSSGEARYLEAGLHKLSATGGNAYNASVRLQNIDTPFNEVNDYMGTGYALQVAALGYDTSNNKFAPVNIHFGSSLTSMGTANAVEYDGTYYTLNVSEPNGTTYKNYSVKIKINFSGEAVSSIDVYTQTGGAWNATPADNLTKARYAKDYYHYVTATAEGTVNTANVEPTFEYAYFSVVGLKDQWLEFSDFAAGTEFWWVNIEAGRTGDIVGQLNIVDGEPIKLIEEFNGDTYNYIAVKPASGATSVSFTVKTSDGPAPLPGISESDPIVLTIDEAYTLSGVDASTPYYFSVTIPEAGKYTMTVYTVGTYDDTRIAAEACAVVGNFLDYLPFMMPSTAALQNGKEESLAAMTYNFSVRSKVKGSIVVSIEKVEEVTGGIADGTYTGTATSGPFTLNFTVVIDSSNVTITYVRMMGGNPIAEPVSSDAVALTDNGNGTYSTGNVLIGSSFEQYTFAPSADGSLNITGSYNFTATKA